MLGHELLVDPARVEVEVRDGIVTLTRQVERRSHPHHGPPDRGDRGVVRIQDWLTFELDDIGLQS